MKPNAAEYNPDPQYFRELVDSSGLTRERLAKDVMGCSDRAIRLWMAGDRPYTYAIQYTLESWVLGV